MDERGGGGDGCAADASTAVDADALTGAETIGEVAYKFIEGGAVGGDLRVVDRVGKKLQASSFCETGFFGKVKHLGLFLLKKRDQGFDSTALDLRQFLQKPSPSKGQSTIASGTDGLPLIQKISFMGWSGSNECFDPLADGDGAEYGIEHLSFISFVSFDDRRWRPRRTLPGMIVRVR